MAKTIMYFELLMFAIMKSVEIFRFSNLKEINGLMLWVPDIYVPE